LIPVISANTIGFHYGKHRKETKLRVNQEKLARPVPKFPDQMEQNTKNYLKKESVEDALPPESGQA
jgi:hypothetical protein